MWKMPFTGIFQFLKFFKTIILYNWLSVTQNLRTFEILEISTIVYNRGFLTRSIVNENLITRFLVFILWTLKLLINNEYFLFLFLVKKNVNHDLLNVNILM